jgi:signal transduction histidine kinase
VVHLAGSELDRRCHACAFFHNRGEEYRALLPFVEEGFQHGDKLFQIVDGDHRAERLEKIAALGVDIAAAERSGQLEVRPWEDAHLRERRFDQFAMQTATRAAHRGAELTEKLLAFSRKQHLIPQAVDLNRLVIDGRDMVERSVGPNVHIETSLSPDLWPAMVDPVQLELAILNLAINSRDAMPRGGRLTISTRNAIIPAIGAAADLTPGDYVAISVADTGTGIAPELLDRVLDPFFTTKEVGKGSGLGLSMVYGVVKQSGGSLHIDTELGSGTAIELLLPRASALAPRDGG